MYSVIVVDGDTETVELLKTGVEWNRLGCRLAGTALSIKEGLFLVQTEKPDLVITDMRIGREKENDFLRILYERQQEKRPLVIILSACRDFEEACRAIRYEAALYLTKPPRMDELEEGILWVLDRLEIKRRQIVRLAQEKQERRDGREEIMRSESGGLTKQKRLSETAACRSGQELKIRANGLKQMTEAKSRGQSGQRERMPGLSPIARFLSFSASARACRITLPLSERRSGSLTAIWNRSSPSQYCVRNSPCHIPTSARNLSAKQGQDT